jgi:hypothetical protein
VPLPTRGPLALFACGAVGAAENPLLGVTPASGLVDAPFHVVIRHIVPGSRAKVGAQRLDLQGRRWTAVGVRGLSYPPLARGLFAYEDLPSTLRGIPLESIRAAAHWLEQRTGAHRVAVSGTSRGDRLELRRRSRAID